MPTVLFTAPYMIPFVDRFKPVFDRYGIELIIPDVKERMEEDDLLKYAGQFDGTICGDDRASKLSPSGGLGSIRSTPKLAPVI
jgi:D-3-phosphoglycerate dehydrogenase